MMLSSDQLEAIQQFDTCTIANAIEHFRTRLRNEGFTRPGLQSMSGSDVRLLGYAATSRIRFSNPSLLGTPYVERTDWWGAVEALPLPRIAVVQDMNPGSGSGAAVGEVHAAILKAFQFSGLITNAGVRDLPAVRRLGFPMFAPFVCVSHSYMHVVDYGKTVNILGMEVRTGDLLYADCHGAVSIPLEIAEDLPAVAAKIRSKDERIVQLCLSPDFSAAKLADAVRNE